VRFWLAGKLPAAAKVEICWARALARLTEIVGSGTAFAPAGPLRSPGLLTSAGLTVMVAALSTLVDVTLAKNAKAFDAGVGVKAAVPVLPPPGAMVTLSGGSDMTLGSVMRMPLPLATAVKAPSPACARIAVLT